VWWSRNAQGPGEGSGGGDGWRRWFGLPLEQTLDLGEARRRAGERRAAGVVTDFDPSRLALARRLAGLQRTALARAVAMVTAAAIMQFEKGQAKPTVPVAARLAEVLDVPVEFFRAGHPVPALTACAAHFRSLRSTTSIEREQALAFAELVLTVLAAVERRVELPPVALPDLDIPPDLTLAEVPAVARRARAAMGVPAGSVPHMLRLLEAHGVAVVRLDVESAGRVDSFCHHQGARPIVLLCADTQDKARSRFDAAHELGHLLRHHDAEPGSRLLEQRAHAFAAEFLAPAIELGPDLPARADWVRLHNLKRHWGISLKALVYRAHALGQLTDRTYQSALGSSPGGVTPSPVNSVHRRPPSCCRRPSICSGATPP
jgi:Zn-dependent peptidase ImmA (M78 family)/transcriptional regulator with XRE-family HTH domain